MHVRECTYIKKTNEQVEYYAKLVHPFGKLAKYIRKNTTRYDEGRKRVSSLMDKAHVGRIVELKKI